ncbi:glycosyltransferase [Paraliobacillus salinarum]|uniref:glycosyltransferase n=1 Tax=Paraliobacillus salinarum TaxID=1158996 RepID=UPI0015F64FB0|nr:glycosyltransferase [Paraliobacillus salinarum]
MDAILIVILTIVVIQFVFVCWNVTMFVRPLERIKQAPTKNRLSVLIPARNEEANIEACLTSVLSQTQAPYEVIVLNDHSTDNTAQMVEALAVKHKEIRLLEGDTLPSGWMGKSFACQQLADHAEGDWFLFLDADARLEPQAVESLLPFLEEQGEGIVSGFPRQLTRTWMEKLVVPMMLFVVLIHLPVYLVRKSKRPMFAAAHGAFIAVNKKSYYRIGGHASIRESLLDDMQLMKRMKQFHFSASLIKVDQLVSMRMYNNWKQVWLGYQKNIFEGLARNSLLFIFVMSYYSFLYILPLVLFFMGANLWYVLLWYSMVVLTKAIIDKVNGVSLIYSLFLPLSVLIVMMISIDSYIRSFRKVGYQWKGRRYL